MKLSPGTSNRDSTRVKHNLSDAVILQEFDGFSKITYY
jgi:hypothetical protein